MRTSPVSSIPEDHSLRGNSEPLQYALDLSLDSGISIRVGLNYQSVILLHESQGMRSAPGMSNPSDLISRYHSRSCSQVYLPWTGMNA